MAEKRNFIFAGDFTTICTIEYDSSHPLEVFAHIGTIIRYLEATIYLCIRAYIIYIMNFVPGMKYLYSANTVDKDSLKARKLLYHRIGLRFLTEGWDNGY